MNKLFLLFLLFPYLLPAQEIRRKVSQNTNEHNIEYYFVLKSDSTLKHGPYRMVNFFGGELIKKGFYYKGMKDSTWYEYSIWGNFLQASGNYLKDVRVGTWTYYKAKDIVEQKYDYTKRKLVYFRPDSSETTAIIRKKDTIKVIPDQPPLYIGGSINAMTFIAQNMKYPDSALKKVKQGIVEIGVIIDANGHAGSRWVKKHVEPSLDKEALNVVKHLPDNWLPAIYKGRKVKSVYIQQVTFVL